MQHHLIILGCGNVAAHLVPAFQQAGVPVARIVGIHAESARALGEKWGVPWSLVDEPLPPEGDIIISALRDGGAANYWSRMQIGSRMLLHTAGSLPLSAAAPYAQRYGVLYLLQSISLNRALDFKKIPVLIEADSLESLEIVRELAKKLSPNVHEMDSVQRASLHLAAVFANNFTNAACCAAAKLAKARNVPFELLLPLIDETAAKLHAMTPLEAQTGPARRWDENVMKKQLDSLADTPDLQELYRSMSLFIHKEQTGEKIYKCNIHARSVVNDELAELFPEYIFEEPPYESDYVADVDYMVRIGRYAVGIQIKPITATANFGNYSLTERMKNSFKAFEEEFGGKVLIVFSDDGEIANKDVIGQLKQEIERLEKLK